MLKGHPDHFGIYGSNHPVYETASRNGICRYHSLLDPSCGHAQRSRRSEESSSIAISIGYVRCYGSHNKDMSYLEILIAGQV